MNEERIPRIVQYGGRRFKRAEVIACAAACEAGTLKPPRGPRDLALRHATMKYQLR